MGVCVRCGFDKELTRSPEFCPKCGTVLRTGPSDQSSARGTKRPTSGFLDLDAFRKKLKLFPADYDADFDGFWKWKTRIEREGGHVLDDNHRGRTYRRLRGILGGWQAYRRSRNPNHWNTLRKSLARMADGYDRIRHHSLLEFSDIRRDALREVWDQLGRVKEEGGSVDRYEEGYYVIAVCKPLMLLWGQTLAFDSRVRNNLPRHFLISKSRSKWTFDYWCDVMKRIEEELTNREEYVAFLRNLARERFGERAPVPYGRLLDIYFFVSA